MRVLIQLLFGIVFLAQSGWSQKGLTTQQLAEQEPTLEIGKSKFLYEFDMYVGTPYIFPDIGFNVGMTKRLSEKFGISAYASARGFLTKLGINARVNHHIWGRHWFGYALGYSKSAYSFSERGSQFSLEFSYNSPKSIAVFGRLKVADGHNFDNGSGIDLGIRTRGKTAGWLSVITTVGYVVLVGYAIGRSK